MKEWLKENYKKCLIILACVVVLILIIYLLLRKPTYEIVFDSNGGSTVSTIKVKRGDKISEPETPKRDGYIFMGWQYNNELYDFRKPVTKKMTLTAYWSLAEGITLDTDSFTLKPGDEKIIKVFVNGKSASGEDLVFESSDEDIAKVDEQGKVVALKDGKVTITIKTKDDKYSANCEVVVSGKMVEVESISISGDNTVTVGNTIKLSVTVKPSDATNENILWKSSDTNIATVDLNGNVTGISAGTVTISVTAENGKTASKTITVEAKQEDKTQPNIPSNPTNPKPSIPSEEQKPNPPESNPSENQGGGTTPSEPETNKDIPVTEVTLTGSSSLKVNESIELTVTITPSNATNKKYTCTSSNPAVATVEPNTCIVTGVNDGEATINVTTDDGQLTAIYDVTVSSEYLVEFTAVRNDINEVTKYNVTVYKNNSVWTGFSSIEYNGKTNKFKEPAIPGMIDTNVSEAKIKVDGQVIAIAKVVYK